MTTYRIGFLMSQNLGHIVHDQLMRMAIAKDPEIQAEWMPIYPWSEDRWQKLPVINNNLTLLSGFRAKDHLHRQQQPFNALFCHTQETAVLLGKYMRQIPTIISMDATPINMDSIGEAYGHNTGWGPVERVKYFLIKKAFQRAAHLVTWNHWAKDSLVNDYGISADKVTVNAPGVDLRHWNLGKEERASSRDNLSPRVLFVGGDFRRKGGEVLVRCARSEQREWMVDIATNEAVPSTEGLSNLRIHRGLQAGTPELLALYRNANIFALPTLGDCLPRVILEAMAMELPVVATRSGGISEIVIHGETGLLIPPNSPEALTEAICQLGKDPARRRAMGIAGRRRVEQHFDGAQSYRALIALIKSVADGGAVSHL